MDSENTIKMVSMFSFGKGQSDAIANDFIKYLRKHRGNADLIANIRTYQSGDRTEEQWRYRLVHCVYEASQMNQLDLDVAIAFVVLMVSLGYTEETGTHFPIAVEGKAHLLRKYALQAYAKLVLTDYERFSRLLSQGVKKLWGIETCSLDFTQTDNYPQAMVG